MCDVETRTVLAIYGKMWYYGARPGFPPELSPATREEGVHMAPISKDKLTEEERKIVSALRDPKKKEQLLAVKAR